MIWLHTVHMQYISGHPKYGYLFSFTFTRWRLHVASWSTCNIL